MTEIEVGLVATVAVGGDVASVKGLEFIEGESLCRGLMHHGHRPRAASWPPAADLTLTVATLHAAVRVWTRRSSHLLRQRARSATASFNAGPPGGNPACRR